MKIFNYNVLSDKLCDNNFYIGYDKEVLDTGVRLNKLKELLTSKIDEQYIICLQEVSLSWRGQLEVFFSEAIIPYRTFSISQGHEGNGYMGIFIAIPYIYGIKKVDYIPIRDLIKKYEHNYTPERFKLLTNTYNHLIVVGLNNNVTIGTYHAPCKYDDDEYMKLYTSEIIKYMSNNYDKVILTGDFNIQPNSTYYGIITEHMRSAYAMMGGEPHYTTYTKHKFAPNTFTGTLDYIFYKGGLTCISVGNIPAKVLCPNDNNISDHVPLEAEFILYNDKNILV